LAKLTIFHSPEAARQVVPRYFEMPRKLWLVVVKSRHVTSPDWVWEIAVTTPALPVSVFAQGSGSPLRRPRSAELTALRMVVSSESAGLRWAACVDCVVSQASTL
jgi:hypothetical protein